MFRPKRFPSSRALVLTSSTISIASLYIYHQSSRQLLTESSSSSQGYESQSQLHGGKVGSITPGVFIWGRDSRNVASLGETDNEIVKRPKMVKAFEGMVLRDLKLHEQYGVAVDEKGDVLQWGLGFNPSPNSSDTPTRPSLETSSPHLTLRNRNITQVTLTSTKIYALSKRGEVYIFPVESELQRLGDGKRASGGLWEGLLRWILWREYEAGVDVVKMKVDGGLKSGEKITSLSSGTSHVLALTSQSRALATPLSLSGNIYGQLGVKRVLLNLPQLSPSDKSPKEQVVILTPNMQLNDPKPLPPVPKNLDPLLLPPSGKFPEPDQSLSPPPSSFDSVTATLPALSEAEQGSIRFCTTLHEIPALKGVKITEMKAGEKHSVAKTKEGRVLGWGANGYGQLGLGASLSLPFIPTPTEIPIARSFPKTSQISCSQIAAGGNLSYFVVNRKDLMDNGRESVEVLATGNGQFGGVGNGVWAHVAVPTRVKTVSGLVEWNEDSKKVAPIDIREIAAGRTHVAVVLDNAVNQPGGIKFGRDVFVWGHNEFYQLGTGKRSNLSTPQHLPPLPYPGLRTKSDDEKEERLIESGTMSPMPHSRLQLAPEIKVKGKMVEETIVAGDGVTAVYWRILSP